MKLKTIPGFTKYMVSEFGDVYSNSSSKYLLHHINKSNGIHSVSLVRDNDGVAQTISVARCIALAYIKNPNPKLYTNAIHKDGDKNNLRVSNIEWGSHYNSSQLRDKRHPKIRKIFLSYRQNINTRKMTDEMIDEMIKRRHAGYSVRQLEEIYPIKKSQIRNLLNKNANHPRTILR